MDAQFQSWLSRSLFAAILLMVAPIASAQISGTWDFAVNISGVGSGNATVVLEQHDDGSLTGSYSGQLGNSDVSGTTDGDRFAFDFDGQMGTVTYEGMLQEDGTLEGSVDLGGMGSGTFTATRQ